MGPVIVKETELIKRKMARGGICALCQNESECTYPVNGRKALTYCDEMTPYPPRQVKVTDKDLNRMITSAKRKKADTENFKKTGLCLYCARAEECTYPSREGGIWICDEYEDL